MTLYTHILYILQSCSLRYKKNDVRRYNRIKPKRLFADRNKNKIHDACMVLCVRNLSLYYMQIVYAEWINRKPYQRLRIRVGIMMIIKPTILSLPKQISAKAVLAPFFARQQSGLGTWENASHFPLVFDLVYRRMDSRRPVEFRVCRRFTRRVHIRSRVRVGVSCTLCAQT